MAEKFDPAIIAAEENLLIDFQFLLQEVMTRKGITLSELAEKAGVSKARVSQVMSSEANPTAKTFARLFCALDEEVCVGTKPKAGKSIPIESPELQWKWTTSLPMPATTDDAQFVALLKDAAAKDSDPSNDNHKQAVIMDSDVMTILEAEAA